MSNIYYRPYIYGTMFLYKRTFRDGLYGTSPRFSPCINVIFATSGGSLHTSRSLRESASNDAGQTGTL